MISVTQSKSAWKASIGPFSAIVENPDPDTGPREAAQEVCREAGIAGALVRVDAYEWPRFGLALPYRIQTEHGVPVTHPPLIAIHEGKQRVAAETAGIRFSLHYSCLPDTLGRRAATLVHLIANALDINGDWRLVSMGGRDYVAIAADTLVYGEPPSPVFCIPGKVKEPYDYWIQGEPGRWRVSCPERGVAHVWVYHPDEALKMVERAFTKLNAMEA